MADRADCSHHVAPLCCPRLPPRPHVLEYRDRHPPLAHSLSLSISLGRSRSELALSYSYGHGHRWCSHGRGALALSHSLDAWRGFHYTALIRFFLVDGQKRPPSLRWFCSPVTCTTLVLQWWSPSPAVAGALLWRSVLLMTERPWPSPADPSPPLQALTAEPSQPMSCSAPFPCWREGEGPRARIRRSGRI